MSTQICKIRGFGYKFDYDKPLFSFMPDIEKEFDFLDIINKDFSYYDFRDYNHPKDKKDVLLAVITDGMGGEYKYVLYIDKVEYIENTICDEYWQLECRFDEYVKKYAKQNIERFLQRKLNKEPQMFEFKHYS